MLENFTGATRLFPIIGDPIAQVKSPFGVTKAFEERGVDAICVPFHVKPADFYNFTAEMLRAQNVDGLIITVPHKFASAKICHSLSTRAAFLESVNTIRKRDGKWQGDMFDGLAQVEACKANGANFTGKNALLIGAGGAGSAIAHAICEAGVKSLSILDLDETRLRKLINRLNSQGFTVKKAISEDYDIVINATPMGMKVSDAVPFSAFKRDMFVGDVVTVPNPTNFIIKAREMGCQTSTGVDMFVQVRDLMVNYLLEK